MKEMEKMKTKRKKERKKERKRKKRGGKKEEENIPFLAVATNKHKLPVLRPTL